MPSTNDILDLDMSASQLSTRKNSLTEQDLINALIKVKKKDTNPLFEVAYDRFSHSFERKFVEKFNLVFEKISKVIDKQKILEKSITNLQEEIKAFKIKNNENVDAIHTEIEQKETILSSVGLPRIRQARWKRGKKVTTKNTFYS